MLQRIRFEGVEMTLPEADIAVLDKAGASYEKLEPKAVEVRRRNAERAMTNPRAIVEGPKARSSTTLGRREWFAGQSERKASKKSRRKVKAKKAVVKRPLQRGRPEKFKIGVDDYKVAAVG